MEYASPRRSILAQATGGLSGQMKGCCRPLVGSRSELRARRCLEWTEEGPGFGGPTRVVLKQRGQPRAGSGLCGRGGVGFRSVGIAAVRSQCRKVERWSLVEPESRRWCERRVAAGRSGGTRGVWTRNVRMHRAEMWWCGVSGVSRLGEVATRRSVPRVRGFSSREGLIDEVGLRR